MLKIRNSQQQTSLAPATSPCFRRRYRSGGKNQANRFESSSYVQWHEKFQLCSHVLEILLRSKLPLTSKWEILSECVWMYQCPRKLFALAAAINRGLMLCTCGLSQPLQDFARRQKSAWNKLQLHGQRCFTSLTTWCDHDLSWQPCYVCSGSSLEHFCCLCFQGFTLTKTCKIFAVLRFHQRQPLFSVKPLVKGCSRRRLAACYSMW